MHLPRSPATRPLPCLMRAILVMTLLIGQAPVARSANAEGLVLIICGGVGEVRVLVPLDDGPAEPAPHHALCCLPAVASAPPVPDLTPRLVPTSRPQGRWPATAPLPPARAMMTDARRVRAPPRCRQT